MLDGNCTFNVLVYADADSDVPLEWGDSDAKEIKNGEKVQLRSFSSSNHRVDTLVSYRYAGSNTVVHVLGLMIVDLAISRTLTETTASVAGNADLLSKRNPVFCALSSICRRSTVSAHIQQASFASFAAAGSTAVPPLTL